MQTAGPVLLMMQAYQAENEMAAERMRMQAAEHKRCISEQEQQMAELQQALMQAQEQGRQPLANPAADAARLQAVLRLQADLQSVQAAADQRERELLQQVGLRSWHGGNVVLSAHESLGVVTLMPWSFLRLPDACVASTWGSPRSGHLSLLPHQALPGAPHGAPLLGGCHRSAARWFAAQVERLRSEQQEGQYRLAAAQAESALLQQTQRQLGESDGLLRQQARIISQLELQLLAQDACGTVAATLGGIRQHQQQSTHPQTETALGQGPGTSGITAEQQDQVEVLQTKLARLQQALALKEEQHQRRIKQLQREHERLQIDEGIR